MESVISYLNKNFEAYIDELKEYLKIPSISANDSGEKEMINCAEFVSQKLKDAGMTKVDIFPTKGHPIVYGEWTGQPGQPTVLIYGHYDVQPADPLELWHSDPLILLLRMGKSMHEELMIIKGKILSILKVLRHSSKQTGNFL